jgi:hypothetical protein
LKVDERSVGHGAAVDAIVKWYHIWSPPGQRSR